MEDSDSDSDSWYICKYCKKNWKGKKALNAHKKEKHLTEIRAKLTGQKGDIHPVINTHHHNPSSSSQSLGYSTLKNLKNTTKECNSIPTKRRKIGKTAVDSSDSDTSSSGDGKEYRELPVNKIFLPSNKFSMSSSSSIPISSSSSSPYTSTLPNCSTAISQKLPTVPLLENTSNDIHNINPVYTTLTKSQKQALQPQPTQINEENLITQLPPHSTTQIDATSDNNNNGNNNTNTKDDDDLEIVYERSSNASRSNTTTPLPQQQQFDCSSLNQNIVSSSPTTSSTTRPDTNVLKDVTITPVSSSSSTLPSPVEKISAQQQQQQAHFKMKSGNLEKVIEFKPDVQNEILSVLSSRPHLNIFSTTVQNPVSSSFHENLEQYQKQKLLQKQKKQNMIKTTLNSQNYTNNNNNNNNSTDNFNPCISSTYSIININTDGSTASITPVVTKDTEIHRGLLGTAPLKTTTKSVSSVAPNNNTTSSRSSSIHNNTIVNDQSSNKNSFTMKLGDLINKVTSEMLLSDSNKQLNYNLSPDSSLNSNNNYTDSAVLLQGKQPSGFVKESIKTNLGTKNNAHQRNKESATITPINSSHPRNLSLSSLNHDSTNKQINEKSQDKISPSDTFKCFCQRMFTSKGGLRRHQTRKHQLLSPTNHRSGHNMNNNNDQSIWEKLLDDSNFGNYDINDSTAINPPAQITCTVPPRVPPPQIHQERSSSIINNETSVEYNRQVGQMNKNLSGSSTTTPLVTSASGTTTIPVGNTWPSSSSKNKLSSDIDDSDIPKNYQCLVCKAYFVTEAGMKNHLKSHNIREKIAYGCSTCQKCFATEEERNIHVEKHHRNLGIPRSSLSKMETRSGDNGKSYPTSTFTNSNTTKQVDVIDIDLSPEPVPVHNFDDETTRPNRITTGKDALSTESESKDKEKSQTTSSTDSNSFILNRCYICAKPFDSVQLLNRHIFSVHSESENNNHNATTTTSNVQLQKPSKFSKTCDLCGIGFPNTTALQIHYKVVGHKS